MLEGEFYEGLRFLDMAQGLYQAKLGTQNPHIYSTVWCLGDMNDDGMCVT